MCIECNLFSQLYMPLWDNDNHFLKYKFDLICFQINLIIIRRTQFLSLLSESQMDGRGNTESWIPQCYQNAYQIQIYLWRIMKLEGIIKIECNFSSYYNFLPKKLLLILWNLTQLLFLRVKGQWPGSSKITLIGQYGHVIMAKPSISNIKWFCLFEIMCYI